MAITKSIKDIKYLSIYIEFLNHLFFWFCGSAPRRGALPQNLNEYALIWKLRQVYVFQIYFLRCGKIALQKIGSI